MNSINILLVLSTTTETCCQRTLSLSMTLTSFTRSHTLCRISLKEEESLMRLRCVWATHWRAHQKCIVYLCKIFTVCKAFIMEEDQPSARQLLDFLDPLACLPHPRYRPKHGATNDRHRRGGGHPCKPLKRKKSSEDTSTVPLLAALNGLFEQVSERNSSCFNQVLKIKSRNVRQN